MEKRRSGKKTGRVPGLIVTLILLLAEAAFMLLLLRAELLSTKYIAIVGVVLLVLLLAVYLLVRKWHNQVPFWIGMILFLIILLILAGGGFYIYRTINTLDTITGVKTETTEVNVYVKQEDAAQHLADAQSYTFGILSSLDRESTDKALSAMAAQTGTQLQTAEYAGLTELADGLNNGECQAIVLNRAYMDVYDDMDNYTEFSSQVRSIETYRIAEEVEERTAPVVSATASDTADTQNTASEGVYTLYISGIDTRGEMTAKSRSDVNIILTVNTNTKQILMVSTPRDYYVPLSISNGEKDKLTHAGIYGINVCMDTLDMLYDINIDYYFRVNFGGFVTIIDALGGITVDSDYEFDSHGCHFTVGENYLNGEEALAFSRERYSFSDGDRQRGRNQMKVIQAVVNKMTSTAFLTNYLDVLDSVDGCFETSVPYDLITKLVRQQLDEGGSYEVLSYSVNGTGDTQKPYSMSQNAYVMVPDESTVEKAKSLMQKVRDGVMISQADVASAAASDTTTDTAADTTAAAQ